MLIDAETDELTLTAYDYETAATARIPAMSTEPGRMLVSGRLLAAVAKTVARDVNVTLADSGGRVRVSCGKSQWELPSMNAADYPTVPGGATPVSEMRGEDLRRAVARVLMAVDRKGAVPALGGVEIVSDDDTLTFTATDRFRLATIEVPWKPVGDETIPATVVPWNLLDEATRAVTSTEPVRFGVVEGSVTIATDTHTLTGRSIAGPYPAWQRLMPTGEPPAVAVVETAALAVAAEQALVVATGNSLRLDFGSDTVQVSAADDSQSARAEAPVSSWRGEPMTIGVNPQFLRDALTGCGSPLVEIHLGASPSRPILVLPVAAADARTDPYRHLLMPVKLAE
jgi:DNA polymerase-3 subunit beta